MSGGEALGAQPGTPMIPPPAAPSMAPGSEEPSGPPPGFEWLQDAWKLMEAGEANVGVEPFEPGVQRGKTAVTVEEGEDADRDALYSQLPEGSLGGAALIKSKTSCINPKFAGSNTAFALTNAQVIVQVCHAGHVFEHGKLKANFEQAALQYRRLMQANRHCVLVQGDLRRNTKCSQQTFVGWANDIIKHFSNLDHAPAQNTGDGDDEDGPGVGGINALIARQATDLLQWKEDAAKDPGKQQAKTNKRAQDALNTLNLEIMGASGKGSDAAKGPPRRSSGGKSDFKTMLELATKTVDTAAASEPYVNEMRLQREAAADRQNAAAAHKEKRLKLADRQAAFQRDADTRRASQEDRRMDFEQSKHRSELEFKKTQSQRDHDYRMAELAARKAAQAAASEQQAQTGKLIEALLGALSKKV